MTVSAADAETFERCMSVGGVALFPADTVYGLACDPDTDEAVRRLYAIKGRQAAKPAAVMFFSVDLALAALAEQAPVTVAAVEALLPGGLTLLLPNPAGRFPLACASALDSLAVRVPALGDALAPLAAVRWPVLATSANESGEPDARSLAEVSTGIQADVDLVIDGGELPGTPSTIVDLRAWAATGEWSIVREGAVATATVAAALEAVV